MRTLSLLTALFVLGLVSPGRNALAQVDGFGFYPSDVHIEDALRGQRYDNGTIILNQTDVPRLFKLSARGNMAPWVSFALREDTATSVTEVTVGPNSELALAVLIDIPASTANGEYAGTVLMENFPLPDQTFSIVAAMEQTIIAHVTGTQRLDVKLGESLAKDVEVGNPLRIQTQVTNAGNVDIVPMVGVVIETATAEASPVQVAQFASETETVKSDKTQTVETLWETAGQAIGAYRASLSVTVQGRDFGTREVSFNIVPVGTLSRAGRIVDIRLVGVAAVGQIARVDVSFANEGQMDALARFAGQVYLDGAPVAESNSQSETLVRTGTTEDIATFFPISAEGKYELRGRVHFGGAQTDEAVVEFRVGDAASGSDRKVVLGLAGLSVVGLLGGAGFYHRRSRRRRVPI